MFKGRNLVAKICVHSGVFLLWRHALTRSEQRNVTKKYATRYNCKRYTVTMVPPDEGGTQSDGSMPSRQYRPVLSAKSKRPPTDTPLGTLLGQYPTDATASPPE